MSTTIFHSYWSLFHNLIWTPSANLDQLLWARWAQWPWTFHTTINDMEKIKPAFFLLTNKQLSCPYSETTSDTQAIIFVTNIFACFWFCLFLLFFRQFRPFLKFHCLTFQLISLHFFLHFSLLTSQTLFSVSSVQFPRSSVTWIPWTTFMKSRLVRLVISWPLSSSCSVFLRDES